MRSNGTDYVAWCSIPILYFKRNIRYSTSIIIISLFLKFKKFEIENTNSVLFSYRRIQVIEYLFTDLQLTERFGHAVEVYRSFNKRATALTQWLKQVR